jgi:itaconate CoA-transferase
MCCTSWRKVYPYPKITSTSIEYSEFSGTGGQLDFVRGAFDSKGGKSIIAFRSTAKDGKISRVVPRLERGAMVTVPRMDTHYLINKYGTACLKGKSGRERVLTTMDVAHPRFRDDLIREAQNIRVL